MRDHVDGCGGPLTVRKFDGGQSNPTYLLQTPTRRYVLRAKPAPAARLLPTAHAIEREFRVMQALAPTEVPVPRVHALCEDEAVIGRAFYIMAHVEGRVFWDQTLTDLPAPQRAAIYDEMNRVLASLHRLDAVGLGLQDFGRPERYVARQVERWSGQYRATTTEEIVAMDRLMDWLPAHLPESAHSTQAEAIVHGDYRLDNLIFHPSEPRVVALLDWELSTRGHALADFSYHCMAWHIPHAEGRGLLGLDPLTEGIPSEAAYVQAYARRMAWDADAIRHDWSYYLAYNLFRVASILQGVAHRARQGT
ncbi:MAG: phosphotransferase, partial [Rhodoferax sp.]|nr:phosphotransferase [Rhodoferax sp.]